MVAFDIRPAPRLASRRLISYSPAFVQIEFRRDVCAMGLLSLLPKEDQYFDLFTQMTLYISAAAGHARTDRVARARLRRAHP